MNIPLAEIIELTATLLTGEKVTEITHYCSTTVVRFLL